MGFGLYHAVSAFGSWAKRPGALDDMGPGNLQIKSGKEKGTRRDLYGLVQFLQKLDAVTLKEPDIAEYINENFYPVRLDAQCKTPIEILGKSYKYKDGYNDLARELTFGRLAFPTLVFMDENFRVIQPIPGMRSADELEMIMHFYAKDYYKDTPWDNFVIMFQNRFEKQAPSTRTVKGKN